MISNQRREALTHTLRGLIRDVVAADKRGTRTTSGIAHTVRTRISDDQLPLMFEIAVSHIINEIRAKARDEKINRGLSRASQDWYEQKLAKAKASAVRLKQHREHVAQVFVERFQREPTQRELIDFDYQLGREKFNDFVEDMVDAQRVRNLVDVLGIQVLVAGESKLLRDCTLEDVEWLAESTAQRSYAQARRAAFYKAIANDMRDQGADRVADLAEAKLAQAA